MVQLWSQLENCKMWQFVPAPLIWKCWSMVKTYSIVETWELWLFMASELCHTSFTQLQSTLLVDFLLSFSMVFLVTIFFVWQIRYLGLQQQLGMFMMWLLSMLSVVLWKGLTVMFFLLIILLYIKLPFWKRKKLMDWRLVTL